MKKIGFLLIILYLIPGFIFSQDENFLGLGLGAAIPQGIYASNDYQTEGAAYANTGFLFGFDGAIFPDNYLGIGATITYASNNPDKEQYKEDLLNDINSRDSISIPEDVTEVDWDYGVWEYLNFHIGPAFTVPAGDFNFDLRILGGLTMAWQPNMTFQFEYEYNDEINNFSTNRREKPVATFGYTAGVGVRYAFSSGFVMRLIGEYTNSKPTFDVTEEITLVDGQINYQTREYSIPIKNFHVAIGIAYNFEL